MNIVNKLTIRNLQKNKKRTIITLFGTIISVAMIFAVTTIAASMMDLLQRNAISNTGEWHVAYEDVSGPEVEALRTFERTSELILHNRLGFVDEDARSTDENKPFLFINEFNEAGLNYFPMELSSGRLPHSSKELVLSTAVEEAFSLGETVTLTYGDRFDEQGIFLDEHSLPEGTYGADGEYIPNEETLEITGERNFTIVGFIEVPSWESPWGPAHTAVTMYDEKELVAGTASAGLIVANHVNRSLYGDVKTLSKEMGKDASFNDELLRYYGLTLNDELQVTLYTAITIILVIIVIGSISLIFNAFAISVSERSQQLGMLSSVGATKRQKRNSVYFEGALIGAMSIPIGLIAGYTGIAITFHFIDGMFQSTLGINQELYAVVTPTAILAAVAISIVTIFFSCYVPARRASRITAIDAIRQTHDVKLTKKVLKTSKLTKWLFGTEAELALKNLKRNKKRYYITVFSLIVSIILFLSVTFFTSTMTQSMMMTQQDPQFDISVYSEERDYENILTDGEVMAHVQAAQFITSVTVIGDAREEQLPERLKSDIESWGQTIQEFDYTVDIIGLDKESYKAILDNATETGEQRGDSTVPAIVLETIQYPDDEAGQYVQTNAIDTSIGDTIQLVHQDWDDVNVTTPLAPVEVIGLTAERPLSVGNVYLGNLVLMMETETVELLLADIEDESVGYETLYLKSDEPNETTAAIEALGDGQWQIYNFYERVESDLQMVVVVSVFTYGFIALITLISIANIINTISTGVGLRKRELAMYRSIGMTPQSFRRMIRYESLFYGIHSLMIGLPLSFGIMYAMYHTMVRSFAYPFTLPWIAIVSVIIAVFAIVTLAMMYASSKMKKESIIDGLKQENS
ncbi:ABC transporter permease [Shouchella lehensis]|uniref:ABC transporter permease n=1 Tax=Shouchella lehensis G1 TaxID=1246626 RepID=A0A060M730_9BACI|nr:ABC transporter permease [Shouchella lehensis]AIC95894.1 ABC transporter permease [Shouchella lehensis G1]